MRAHLAMPVLALVLAGAAPVLLADDDDRRGTAYRLAAPDIVALLEAQGYRDIHDVELDDGRYEVEARAPDGREVDLEIDPDSGAILEMDYDD